MIVAGIGCRKGVSEAQVLAAVAAAFADRGLEQAKLGFIATGEVKRDEPAIAAAARRLNVPLMVVDDARLRGVAARCLTTFAKSTEIAGVPSLSEAAALVATGSGGELLGPRIALNGVTCALGRTAARGRAGGAA